MSEKVSDEMLMAYADGELDGQAAETVRNAIARAPALADRTAKFEMTRDAVRVAFAAELSRPMPEALVASIMEYRPDNVVLLSRRRLVQAVLPLAASIALLFGAGGYWYGQRAVPAGDANPMQLMAEALGETAGGEKRSIRLGTETGEFTTLATYQVDGGLCRTFEVSGTETQNVRGVGCNRGADWTVELTVAQAGGDGYSLASDAATSSIDAFLDAVEARQLTPEEEAAAGGD